MAGITQNWQKSLIFVVVLLVCIIIFLWKETVRTNIPIIVITVIIVIMMTKILVTML